MKTKTADPAQLTRLLKAVFRQQARELLSRLTPRMIVTGEGLDLNHWTPAMTAAVKPAVLQTTQTGVLNLLGKLGHVPRTRPRQTNFAGSPFGPSKSLRRFRWPFAKSLRLDFDLYNPSVLTAVDSASLAFCQATNQTATEELQKVLPKLRALLKEGLAQGDAVRYLASKILKLFSDPYRAYRIAQTETFRALNAGELISAKESGVVQKKRWTTSWDACESCLKLDDKEVGLDEPFWVNPKGGPYAVVSHPPFHPFCMCTWVPVLD